MFNTEKLCIGCMNENGGEKICSVCGYDSTTENDKKVLPARFVLKNRYMTGHVIKEDCEGVTYIGWDKANDTAVHIREYMPKGAAKRNPDRTVGIEPENKYTFNEGLMQFLELAKVLEDEEITAVVPVTDSFEENGTAYKISPIIQSISLEDFLIRNGGNLKWEQARPLFLPLIDTLGALHKKRILLGGISPDTISVSRDGKLRFSNITIQQIHDNSSGFETELYDGYSAVEQYGLSESKMNEASDVYALSAVIFRVLIGTVPPKATDRLEKDSLSIPSHFAEELPRQVLVSIANGLQVSPLKRTSNLENLKNELVYGETAERAKIVNKSEKSVAKSQGKTSKTNGLSSMKYAAVSAGVTAAVFLVIAVILVIVFRDKIFNPVEVPLNTSSDYVTQSDGPEIGDYDSEVVNAVKLYPVPDFTGKHFSQIEEIDGYEKIKVEISGKEYSDKHPRGAICAQSVAPGTEVEKETTVKVTISLGKKEFEIADVIKRTKEDAIIELLKQGFLYENIEVGESYDSSEKTGVVTEQIPEAKTKTNAEAVVKIYVNTYTNETNTENN